MNELKRAWASVGSLLIGHVKDKWHVNVKFRKGQDLAKLSKRKARNLREREMQDAQERLGSEGRKAKNGEKGGRKCNMSFSIQLFLAVARTA